MEGRLTAIERRELTTRIGTGDKKFQLLYSFTVDGCNPTTFHQKCDSQGPTVTVLYNTSGYVFGGYTSQHWHSNGAYTTDQSAFLFRLQSQGKFNPVFLSVTNGAYAIYGNSTYGPTFGDGHDFYIFSGAVNKTGNYYPLNGYGFAYLGQGYNKQNENAITMTGNTTPMYVTDLEVYKVTGMLI